MKNDFWRIKGIDAARDSGRHGTLARTLSWPHLVALGIGAIIGTGIYTLIGEAAGLAGPAVIISFAIAGLVCACAALAYTELSTLIPTSGSAYTYSYAALGEPVAWIVGWSLILEYTVVCATVAVGWSEHFSAFLHGIGIHVPAALATGPLEGGILNLPAIIISMAVAGLLALGTRESARLTVVLVVLKVSALAIFVALTLPHFDGAHFQPFMPLGFAPHMVENGKEAGVMGAAAIIFFAFYGFDAVSTAAEETRNPGRDLTIGILGSMVACTTIYIVIAACAIGALPVPAFAGQPAPLVHILQSLQQPAWGGVVAAAAVIALPTVILAFMYGQSRIFFVMARDHLLPRTLATVSARTQTPVVMTLIVGLIVSVLAGLLPLALVAALANAGTLCAFTAVCVSLMVLRRRDPLRERVFRTPAPYLVGSLGVIGCLYLFASLPALTRTLFFAWNGFGFLVYLLYARSRSRLAPPPPKPEAGSLLR
jgi:basic amino acid/polyamine antiporter, APA family